MKFDDEQERNTLMHYEETVLCTYMDTSCIHIHGYVYIYKTDRQTDRHLGFAPVNLSSDVLLYQCRPTPPPSLILMFPCRLGVI